MIDFDNKKKILYIIIAVFVLAKIFVALSFHAPWWDEAVYTGMGKYLYSGGSSGLWETIRAPGLPLLLGAFWKAGLPVFFSEMLMTVFAVGNLLLAYAIAKKLFNAATGLLSALLIASSTIFFQHSSLFLTEIASTFFALATLYFLISRKLAIAAIFAAVAALFKFPHLLLIAVLALPLLLQFLKNKKIKEAAQLIPYFIIMFIFLIVNYFAYGNAFEPFLLAATHAANPFNAVSGLMQNIFFYAIVLLKQNIFFIFLPLGIAAVIKERKSTLLLSYLIIYLTYFTAIGNKQERFVLLFMPAAAIFAAYGIYQVLLTAKGTTKIGVAIAAALFLMASFVSYNVIADDFGYYKYRQQDVAKNFSYEGTVLTSNPEIAYYTDAKVIPFYFSTADGEEGIRKAIERFEKNKGSSEINFNINDFYCADYDIYCKEQLTKITGS